ncbi:MAG: hypothetical protein L6455_13300 [Kiritimatiellae bacterium]|nr:hypothetical protein [Kiritimatiellia bacterium]
MIEFAYAERDITPLPGEELAGYGYYINRRADTILDPLYLRVCGFRQGVQTAVLIQFDLVGLQADHVEELRGRLQRAHGLPPQAVLFHCTHTHTGPSSKTTFGCGEMTQTWRGILTKHVLQTVDEALKAWRPVTRARWFDQDFEGIAINRDDPHGPVDSRVRGLLIERPPAAPVVLVNYACHPVAIGVRRAYSADYPGAVVRRLAAAGYQCIFLTAPCGDLDPIVSTVVWGRGTEDALRLYGNRIGDAVERGIAGGEDILLDEVHFNAAAVALNVQLPVREQCEKAAAQALVDLEKDPANGLALYMLNGSCRWIEMLDSGRYGGEQPVEVQSLALGPVVIAGLAVELFSELATTIRERSGLRRLLLAGTSNAVVGYVVTRRSIERGSYASQSARCSGRFSQQPGSGEAFAEAVADFLSK